MKYAVFLLMIILVGCAGPNPNPGERTTDIAWIKAQYSNAFDSALPYAETGRPWAQLRLGIFYYNGWGVERNPKEAAKWYSKAMINYGDNSWSNGQMVGAIGESGYFNQNSDALIARFNLASMYYSGVGVDKDLNKALNLVNEVIEKSDGKPIFFCCEFSESRFFTQEQFVGLKTEIQKELNQP